MFGKKKKNLTEEEIREQETKDEIILNQQIKTFELYKKYVEPIYSKIFEQIKLIIMFLFVLNGTALLTAITTKDSSFKSIIQFSQFNLYLLFAFILYLITMSYMTFWFLDKRKSNKNYIKTAYSHLRSIIFSTFILCIVQVFNFIGMISVLEDFIKNVLN